jgi:hypothetical protein
MRRGIYRIKGVGDLPDDVRVDDDGITLPMAEAVYRVRGHAPPVEALPWQNEYLAQTDLPVIRETPVLRRG